MLKSFHGLILWLFHFRYTKLAKANKNKPQMFEQSSIKGETVGQESVLRCTKEIPEQNCLKKRREKNYLTKRKFFNDEGCSLRRRNMSFVLFIFSN